MKIKNQLKSNSPMRQESMNVCRTVWSECESWQCSCSLHFRCSPSVLKATFDISCSCPRQWSVSRLLSSQHLTSFRFSTQELLGSCRSPSDLQTCSLEIQKVTSPQGPHSQPRAPDRSWRKSPASHFFGRQFLEASLEKSITLLTVMALIAHTYIGFPPSLIFPAFSLLLLGISSQVNYLLPSSHLSVCFQEDPNQETEPLTERPFSDSTKVKTGLRRGGRGFGLGDILLHFDLPENCFKNRQKDISQNFKKSFPNFLSVIYFSLFSIIFIQYVGFVHCFFAYLHVAPMSHAAEM